MNEFRPGLLPDDGRLPIEPDWFGFSQGLVARVQADLMRAYWYVPERPMWSGKDCNDPERKKRESEADGETVTPPFPLHLWTRGAGHDYPAFLRTRG